MAHFVWLNHTQAVNLDLLGFIEIEKDRSVGLYRAANTDTPYHIIKERKKSNVFWPTWHDGRTTCNALIASSE